MKGTGGTGIARQASKRPPASRMSGFTLVELLIALVLSSVIFASAYQVISNLVQYQVRSQLVQGSQLDQWLLANLLGEIIEKSVAQVDLPYRFSREPVFAGESDRMTLISRAYSNNFDDPGYRSFRLFERGGELWLAYRKFDENFRRNREFETRTGLALDAIRFEYLAPEGWTDRWRTQKTFPSRIRTRVKIAGKPDLLITRNTSFR